jgi:uncharacterized membrane protein
MSRNEQPERSDPVSVPHNRGFKIQKSVLIHRPVAEIYHFWRNFENLPRFMDHLQTVVVIDDKRSRWVAKGPAGTSVEWEAEIINEIRNEVIGWRSLENAQVANAGSVRFEEAFDGRGTILTVNLKYDPPAGALGAAVAKLFGEDPEKQIEEDLQRLKTMMEVAQTP